MTGRPIQNGFAGEFIYEETNPSGSVRNLEIDFWDPATQSFAYVFVGTDGYAERGPFWMKGLITTSEISVVVDGKTYQERAVETIAADSQSYTKKMEFSTDGKKWLPLSETKYFKLAPPPSGTKNNDNGLIKHEVAETVQGLFSAFSRADIDGILSFYADDPEFRAIEPDGKVTDSAAFRKSTREFFAGVASESIQTRSQDIRIIDPDTAILTWNGGFQTRMKDGTTVGCDSYGATFVFRRIGKDWKIIHDHESGVPPQPVKPVAASSVKPNTTVE